PDENDCRFLRLVGRAVRYRGRDVQISRILMRVYDVGDAGYATEILIASVAPIDVQIPDRAAIGTCGGHGKGKGGHVPGRRSGRWRRDDERRRSGNIDGHAARRLT